MPSGIAASSDFQCEIGMPYFFSIEGKYEAGPVTFSVVMLPRVLLPSAVLRAHRRHVNGTRLRQRATASIAAASR